MKLTEMKYFYTARENRYGGFCGIVYHYDSTGNTEIRDYISISYEDRNEALDVACLWCDHEKIDAELE